MIACEPLFESDAILKASRHIRRIRLRSTARAAIFFETTHANFGLFVLFFVLCDDTDMVKYTPWKRRDRAGSIEEKSARERRWFWGI